MGGRRRRRQVVSGLGGGMEPVDARARGLNSEEPPVPRDGKEQSDGTAAHGDDRLESLAAISGDQASCSAGKGRPFSNCHPAPLRLGWQFVIPAPNRKSQYPNALRFPPPGTPPAFLMTIPTRDGSRRAGRWATPHL